MNILKLASEAMKVTRTVSNKQLLGGAVALFGTGMLIGSLFNCSGKGNKVGDNFERQDSIEQKVDSTELKQPVDTIPIPTVDNYDKVTVGKNGIESADTLHYAGTDKIAEIDFYSDKNKKDLKHVASFDENGKLSDYTWYSNEKEFFMCNAKNERLLTSEVDENDWQHIHYHSLDTLPFYQTDAWYDKKGNLKIEQYNGKIDDILPNGRIIFDTYKKYHEADGSTREEGNANDGKYIEYQDKNGRFLKKKVLDSNDVLKYTVIPKYDKEGTLIKNDTIRNKK